MSRLTGTVITTKPLFRRLSALLALRSGPSSNQLIKSAESLPEEGSISGQGEGWGCTGHRLAIRLMRPVGGASMKAESAARFGSVSGATGPGPNSVPINPLR